MLKTPSKAQMQQLPLLRILNCQAWGQLSEYEARALRHCLKDPRIQNTDELLILGTLSNNALDLLASVKKPQQKLILLEDNEFQDFGRSGGHFALMPEYIHEARQTHKLHYMKMGISHFFGLQRKAPGLVLINQCFDYADTREAILWAKSVQAKVICGYHYSPDFPGVMKAIAESGGYLQRVGQFWLLNH